jgi:photosystem II stability/assembly factor-like uncharacterized protein
VAFGPAGRVYAGTFGQGLYFSPSDGAGWQPWGPSNRSVTRLALRDDELVACLGPAGMARSGAATPSWTLINTGLPELDIQSLAVHPAGSLFAGGSAYGVLRWDDAGSRWTMRNEGLGGVRVQSLAADASGRLFAVTVGGLFVTTDRGRTWAPGGLANSGAWCATAEAGGGVLVGGSQGVYRSRDGGQSWVRLNSTGLVQAVAEDPTGVYLAATETGMIRSRDAGGTWNDASAGLGGASVGCFAIHPDGTVLAGSLDGVFASHDHGAGWSRRGLQGHVVVGLAADAGGQLLAAALDGVYRSADAGASWDGPILEGRALDVFATAAGELLAATETDVFHSLDGGATWQSPPDAPPPPVLAFTVDRDGFVYAASTSDRVYRSIEPQTPVEVADFGAAQAGADVVLRWRVAGETAVQVSRAPAGTRRFAALRAAMEPLGGGWWSLCDAAPGAGRWVYRLTASGDDGADVVHAEVEIEVAALLLGARLAAASPNPFTERTWMSFVLSRPGTAAVDLFDARGRRLRTLFSQTAARPGSYRLEWDGRDAGGRRLPSGLYFARLTVEGQVVETRRAVRLE